MYELSCGQRSSSYTSDNSRLLLVRIANHKGICLRASQSFNIASTAGRDINKNNFGACHAVKKFS